MGQMGYGYGSECHLLRFMGRHRQELDAEILRQAGLSGRIDWRDFRFKEHNAWSDQELEGLAFIPKGHPARVEWEIQWPQVGTLPNWDAIGTLIREDGTTEVLLIEAKAHLAEMTTAKGCGAKEGSRSRNMIDDFFRECQARLKITPNGNWMGPYYQYANRIAILELLNRHNLPSRLICIYFVGDRGFAGRNCPTDQSGWSGAVLQQDHSILDDCSDAVFKSRIHKVYLHVLGVPPSKWVHANE